MEENTNKEEQTQEKEHPETTGVGAFFQNKWKAVAGRFGKLRKSEKEAETKEEEESKENEQLNAAEMIATFNRGWETVVDLVVRLTGLGKSAARNAILVAIAPLLTAAVQMVNWAYLYVHYHLGYNVPVAYLTVDTPWLVSFGIGVIFMSAFVFALVYLADLQGMSRRIGVLVFTYLSFMVSDVGLYATEFGGVIYRGLIWIGLLLILLSRYFIGASETKSGYTLLVITVFLDVLFIALIYIWYFKPILARWILEQYMDSEFMFGLYLIMIVVNSKCFLTCKIPQRVAGFQFFLVLISAIFVFIIVDDSKSREAPYAVIISEQQVIVYQSKEVSVLEPATIEVDEETNEVTLTIDTSQQQIVDSTTLSYEYQSFDTVNIE